MRRFVLCLLLFASAMTLKAENLLTNTDFRHGFTGYHLGDNLHARTCLPRFSETPWGRAVTFTAPAECRMGFFLPAVPVKRGKTYELRFRAKSSRNGETLTVSEYIRTGSRARFQLTLSDRWKEYSFRFVPSPENGWCGFRILKTSPQEVTLSFTGLRLGPLGNPESSPSFSTDLKTEQEDFRFAPGERFSAKFEIFNHTAEEKRIRIRSELSSVFSGGSCGKEWKNATVPPGERTVLPIEVSLPGRNDLYCLSVEVEGEETSRILQYLAVVPRVRAAPGELPVDLGINSPLTFASIQDVSESELRIFAEAGFSFLRMWDSGNPFVWGLLEPEEGRFEWRYCDRVVQSAQAAGLCLLINLGGMFFQFPAGQASIQHGLPQWLYRKSKFVECHQSYFTGKGRRTALPPLRNWENLVRSVSERYRGKVAYYEILNEPNLFLPEEEYLRYLNSACGVLQETDPSASILGICATGDASGDVLTYTRNVLQRGGGRSLTGVSFHPYSTPYEDSPSAGDAALRELRSLLSRFGMADAELWNTELYYLIPLSEGEPASAHPGYLIRRYLLDAAEGVRGSLPLPGGFLLGFAPALNSNFYRESAPGLFGTKGYVPNTKYIATAVFSSLLKGCRFQSKRILPGEACVYRFSGPGREVAAVFLLNEKEKDPRRLVFRRTEPSIALLDVMGNPLPETDGKTELSATPFPCWVSGRDPESMERFLRGVEVQGIDSARFLGARAALEENGWVLYLSFHIQKKGVPFTVEFPDGKKLIRQGSEETLSFSVPFSGSALPEHILLDGRSVPLHLNRTLRIPEGPDGISETTTLDSPEWKRVPEWKFGKNCRAGICIADGKLWFSVFAEMPESSRGSNEDFGKAVFEILLDGQPLRRLDRTGYRSGWTHRFVFSPGSSPERAELSGSSLYFRRECRWRFRRRADGWILTAGFPLEHFRYAKEPFLGFDLRIRTGAADGESSFSGTSDSDKNRFRFAIGTRTMRKREK